jgi:Zn-dependent protease
MPFHMMLIYIVITLTALVFTLVIHELCHGLAAYALGDPTARRDGRLSLNPLRHIEPFGALMMLLVGFGWARPVSVNPRFFDNPKRDMALTALAGPISNFLLAFLSVGVMKLFDVTSIITNTVGSYIGDFFFYMAILSTGLGIFNLIPIPPLDGSKVLAAFLPDRLYWRYMQIERYGMFILMGLLLLDRYISVFGFIGAIRGSILSVFMNIFGIS